MKLAAVAAAFLLGSVCACPRPAPLPVTPAPSSDTCGLAVATHDIALDNAATTLQERGDVDSKLIETFGRAAVVCIVEQLAADEVSAAPKLAAVARHWLDVEGSKL